MLLVKDLFNLFFPEICLCCKTPLTTSEKIICTLCNHDLPLTHFCDQKNNKLEKSFFGRVPLEAVTAFLYYRKRGKVQQLIQQLKYKNHREIGTFLGEWMSTELKKSPRFNNINYIIPVPLHPKKLKKRGYNQVTDFGHILAKNTQTTYTENILIRKSASNTQTLKQRFERWKNVHSIFYLTNTQIFENKHVLLIDDVITTGATIEACCNELLKTPNIKISVAAMAFTE